jgi:hypothetical protein
MLLLLQSAIVKIWIPFEVSQSLSFPLFHHRAGRVEVTVNHLPESEPPSEEDLRASHILWCSVMYADKVMFPIMLEQRLRTQVIERKRLFDALELEDEDPTADYLWRSRSPELETHLYAVYGQSEDTTMTSLMERDGTSFAQHYEQQGLPCPPSMMQELLWEAHEVRLRTKSRLYMEGMPVPARRRVVHLPAYAFRSHWCRRDVCCATQLLPSVIRTIRSLHACDGALAVLQKGLLQQTLPFNALELRVALTPAAAGMPFSLERLEFIGDSVLKMLVSRLAFCDFPYNEGAIHNRVVSVLLLIMWRRAVDGIAARHCGQRDSVFRVLTEPVGWLRGPAAHICVAEAARQSAHSRQGLRRHSRGCNWLRVAGEQGRDVCGAIGAFFGSVRQDSTRSGWYVVWLPVM